jgi:hypothetical protein
MLCLVKARRTRSQAGSIANKDETNVDKARENLLVTEPACFDKELQESTGKEETYYYCSSMINPPVVSECRNGCYQTT